MINNKKKYQYIGNYALYKILDTRTGRSAPHRSQSDCHKKQSFYKLIKSLMPASREALTLERCFVEHTVVYW